MFPSPIAMDVNTLSECLGKRIWGSGTLDQKLTIADPLAPSGLSLEDTLHTHQPDAINDPGLESKADQYIIDIEKNGQIPQRAVEELINIYPGLREVYIRMNVEEKRVFRYTIGFAIKAHRGETRKSKGERYSQHWLRIMNRIATDASEFYDQGIYLAKAKKWDLVIPRTVGNIFFLDIMIGGAIHDVVEHRSKKKKVTEKEAYKEVKQEYDLGLETRYQKTDFNYLLPDIEGGFNIAFLDTNKTGEYTKYLADSLKADYAKGIGKREVEGALIVKANDTTDNSNQLDNARKTENYPFLVRSLIKSEYIINLLGLYFKERQRNEGPITTILWNTMNRARAANYLITQRELEHFSQTKVTDKQAQKTVLQGLNEYTAQGGMLDVTSLLRRRGDEDTIHTNLFHGYSELFYNILNERWTNKTKKYWDKITSGDVSEILRTHLVLHQLSIFNYAGRDYALSLNYKED